MPHFAETILSPFSRSSSPSLQRRQLKKKSHRGSAGIFCSRIGRSRPLSRTTRQGCGHACTKNAEGLIHNAENQITQMDGGAAVYGYDGEGRRMKKTVGSETTYYFYGPGGLLCEFSTSNAISSATAASSTDKTLYRTSDKLGSAVLIINASGVVIENNRTLPYGEAWIAENTPSTNDKKFTTYQRDQESNLDYAIDRYLANNNGRFQSPDTKGYPRLFKPSMLNRYVYTSNDPINHLDPTGNDEEGSVIPEPFSPTQRPDCIPWWGNWETGLPICEPKILVAVAVELARTIIPGRLPQPEASGNCGVNPVTGNPGINAAASGIPGELRPGVGGGGSFGAPRPANNPPLHRGIDIAGGLSSNIHASLGGKVLYAGWIDQNGWTVNH
jgi:RHS repeat-associated protein